MTAADRLQIRAADPEDIPLILGFIRDLAQYEKLSHEVVATPELLRRHLFEENRGVEILLAFAGGTPVGFALFFHNFSTFLGRPGIYLEDLYVKPEFRGRGYGRQLLVKLAALAHERGCGRLEWSVLDWNEPAIRFYKNLGARALDEWTMFRLTGSALERLAREGETS